jgi:CheY-like chemotaxis protein
MRPVVSAQTTGQGERNDPMASILIVDDDNLFLTMLRAALTRAGYDVLAAPDGYEGLKLYEREPTDLVITDLVMPEKEGLELITQLKRLNPKVKIIAISGAREGFVKDYLKIAKALGAQRVVGKPFTEQEILEAVSEVLSGR